MPSPEKEPAPLTGIGHGQSQATVRRIFTEIRRGVPLLLPARGQVTVGGVGLPHGALGITSSPPGVSLARRARLVG